VLDIHTAFDAATFLFTRKQNLGIAFPCPYVYLGPKHVFTNVAIEIPAAVYPVFMLTRLAWAILPELHEQRGEVDCQVETVFRSRVHKGAHWRRAARHPEYLCGATVRRKRQREDTTSDAAGTLDAILKRPRLDLDIFDVNEE
jgi:hypothetical protein